MIVKMFFVIFATVLFAELGDKTQLATLLFATNKEIPKIVVFFASALALIFASGVAVLAGSVFSKYINPKILSLIAGIGFILIGIWTILKT